MALLPAPTLANPGTASWQLCLAGGLEKPRWLGAAGGKKWGGGGPLLPTFCGGLCPNLCPNPHPSVWAGGWG